jgi:L-threonylcarbamoyladenylate synthase
MGGAVEHVRVSPENILCAVAVVNVEINDRHPLGTMALPGVEGGNRRLIEKAEAHGAVLLGMMAGWAHGAKGIAGLAPEHRINGRRRRSHRPHGGFQRMRRHYGIRVDVFEAAFRCHTQDLPHMLGRMGQQQLLLDGPGGLAANGGGKVGRLQHRIDRLDAVDPLGVAGRRFMAQAGTVGVNEGRHGLGVADAAPRCYSAAMTRNDDIAHAVAVLRQGGLVAFPTETVYGLGADACSNIAVAKVFAAKGRPQFNPLIAHVHDLAAAERLGVFPPLARKLAQTFWPGPLTIVVERTPDCPVSQLASGGLTSLALRVPSHPVALALLAAFGGPVVAPSANASGRISPTTAAHVRASLAAGVDMIIDGGPAKVGVESTVVSFLDSTPRLLRPGGLSREQIEACLGVPLSAAAAGPLHAPGQLESHYAPKATLRLNAEAPKAGETYLGFGSHGHGPHTLSATGNLIEAAANLFGKLHEIDTAATAIAVAPIPETGLGEAINDRLRRAAAPRP